MRLIDGEKLIEWLDKMHDGNKFANMHDEASAYWMSKVKVKRGEFDIPSTQGEARLRDALNMIPEKIMDINGWADTEELNFPIEEPTIENQNEWFDTFIAGLELHVRGVIEETLSEVFSSHTEDGGQADE